MGEEILGRVHQSHPEGGKYNTFSPLEPPKRSPKSYAGRRATFQAISLIVFACISNETDRAITVEQVEAHSPTPTTSFHTLIDHDTRATKASTFRVNAQTPADRCFCKGSLNSQPVRKVCLSFQTRSLS